MKKYILLNLLFTTNVGIFAQATEWSWGQSSTDFFPIYSENIHFHGLVPAEYELILEQSPSESMDANQSDTFQSKYDAIGGWPYEVTAADNEGLPISVPTNGSEFDHSGHTEEPFVTPSEPELIVPENPDPVQLPSRSTTKKRKPTENSERNEAVPFTKKRKIREIAPSQEKTKVSKNNNYQNQIEYLIEKIAELEPPSPSEDSTWEILVNELREEKSFGEIYYLLWAIPNKDKTNTTYQNLYKAALRLHNFKNKNNLNDDQVMEERKKQVQEEESLQNQKGDPIKDLIEKIAELEPPFPSENSTWEILVNELREEKSFAKICSMLRTISEKDKTKTTYQNLHKAAQRLYKFKSKNNLNDDQVMEERKSELKRKS